MEGKPSSNSCPFNKPLYLAIIVYVFSPKLLLSHAPPCSYPAALCAP